MKNTLKSLVLSAVIGTLALAGCDKNPEVKVDPRLPKVANNQSLILHPDYLDRSASLGYTLLTDTDRDGSWDIAERYHAGYTNGDGMHKYFFKEGFGPPRPIEHEFEFVTSAFFEPYQ